MNFNSTQIASIVANSVKTNPSILVRSLIAEIQNHYGYTVSYKNYYYYYIIS